ncbi:MAG: hypothetical protein AAGJ40_23685 [Planctomycetota bacterium]
MSRLPDLARRQLWQERLDRFAHSNLSVVQFCQQEGISAPSFYQWKKKLAHATEAHATEAPTPAFVPLSLGHNVEPQVRLTLPGGATIDLQGRHDQDELCQLLAAVITVTRSETS